MGASATQETRKKDPTSLIQSRGEESTLRPAPFKETNSTQPSMADAKREDRAEPNFSHDFSRIPSQVTSVQFQTKLAINQPGDEYEQEADRIAEEVVNESVSGICTSKAPGTTVMRQAAGKSGGEKEEEKYKDAAKKTGEAFLETDLGKKLTEQAKKKGEEFITSIPGMVITGAAAAGAVGYLAATNKELPIGLPEIPLDKLHPGLKMKITYEGPVLSPTKAMIMFSGTFGGPKEEKKPGMTKTEIEKAKTAKMAAEMAAFQEMLKTPEQKKAEEEALTKFTAEKFGPKLPGTKAGALAVPSLTLTPPTLEYKKKSYKLLEEELKLDVPGIEIKPEEETEKKKKDEEKPLQRKAQSETKDCEAFVDVPPIVHEVLRSPGQPLDENTREFMESRFGHDFSQVRVHTDAKAAKSARAVNALAYTVGRDVAFGAGQYAPTLADRRRLIAHELTHIVQQSGSAAPMGKLEIGLHDSTFEREADLVGAAVSAGDTVTVSSALPSVAAQIQRDGFGEVRRAEARAALRDRLKLDYKKAEKSNKTYAKTGPAWEAKLSTVAGGAYKAWHDLWSAGNYNGFADKVASYQIDLGLPEKNIDGVIGPGTWARIAGLGEAMAGITKVVWPESEYTCTTASVERIKRGVKLATGKVFELPEDKDISEFNIIAQTFVTRMLDIDLEYRGSGPAGALAYAGLGELVPEADIWAGKLEPGAVIQVWGSRKDYELLRAGEIGGGVKKRRIRDGDSSFYGTSFVFVRYDTESKERMLVRHYGSTEWKRKSSYDVWVAAKPFNP